MRHTMQTMRRSIEIPDATWARTKAAAALTGMTVADFVAEALQKSIQDTVGMAPAKGNAPASRPRVPVAQKPKSRPMVDDSDLPFVTRR